MKALQFVAALVLFEGFLTVTAFSMSPSMPLTSLRAGQFQTAPIRLQTTPRHKTNGARTSFSMSVKPNEGFHLRYIIQLKNYYYCLRNITPFIHFYDSSVHRLKAGVLAILSMIVFMFGSPDDALAARSGGRASGSFRGSAPSKVYSGGGGSRGSSIGSSIGGGSSGTVILAPSPSPIVVSPFGLSPFGYSPFGYSPFGISPFGLFRPAVFGPSLSDIILVGGVAFVGYKIYEGIQNQKLGITDGDHAPQPVPPPALPSSRPLLCSHVCTPRLAQAHSSTRDASRLSACAPKLEPRQGKRERCALQ
jgi:hypothetical protein